MENTGKVQPNGAQSANRSYLLIKEAAGYEYIIPVCIWHPDVVHATIRSSMLLLKL